ncbi:MAG: SDR family oxidoreductase [Sulfuritalea sp.]|nr:SDR family oxidoreductase [Sulfuritalea sp.]
MRVLVLGAGGMIGSAMFRILSERDGWTVWGSVRSERAKAHFSGAVAANLISRVEFMDSGALVRVLSATRPEVVINCVGLTKHLADGNVPAAAIAMNALFPHRLADLCALAHARLIHVSTDCVFAGTRGNYTEDSNPDATDIYGRSKALGEVMNGDAVTLRTSTIGHELEGRHGLLEWFLAQKHCKGYSKAFFSGLPSVVFAKVVRDIVIPDRTLTGLYHIGGQAISKDRLLRLIAQIYQKKIEIVPDTELRIDRTLNSSRFSTRTGYVVPSWPELIETMYANR